MLLESQISPSSPRYLRDIAIFRFWTARRKLNAHINRANLGKQTPSVGEKRTIHSKQQPTLCLGGSHPWTGSADPAGAGPRLAGDRLQRFWDVVCLLWVWAGPGRIRPIQAYGRLVWEETAHSRAKGDPKDDCLGSQNLSRGLRGGRKFLFFSEFRC